MRAKSRTGLTGHVHFLMPPLEYHALAETPDVLVHGEDDVVTRTSVDSAVVSADAIPTLLTAGEDGRYATAGKRRGARTFSCLA